MTYFAELQPADIIVFGGSGDLSIRKIIPALFYRLKDGQLPEESRIIVLGRHAQTREEHMAALDKTSKVFLGDDFEQDAWDALTAKISYVQLDAYKSEDFVNLAKVVAEDARPVRVFYLATPADIFGPISHELKKAGAITDESRVVLEKPLGYDLDSFNSINNAVLECFTEEQVYRIDHYLGKETVQNLMVLRFSNDVFARIWDGNVVDHVQITVSEDIGVGERYSYYDDAGALRDMVQNHLLQLLCMTAMEAPNQVTPDAVRDEKLKVMRALRLFTPENVEANSVRGQYAAGEIDGEKVGSYLEDIKIDESNTETFVALRAHIDNWRWSGVPFYMRTGKRMPARYSEIVIRFKPVPHNIFGGQAETPAANKLIIHLQPDEHVKLQIVTKVPGPGGYRLKPVDLNLSLKDEFEERTPEAYERLLMDVVRGNQTLFMRTDELDAAWVWTESILDSWEATKQKSELYAAGTAGPESAMKMLTGDDRKWFEDDKEEEK